MPQLGEIVDAVRNAQHHIEDAIKCDYEIDLDAVRIHNDARELASDFGVEISELSSIVGKYTFLQGDAAGPSREEVERLIRGLAASDVAAATLASVVSVEALQRLCIQHGTKVCWNGELLWAVKPTSLGVAK